MLSPTLGLIPILIQAGLLLYGIWLVVQGETKPRRLGGLAVLGLAFALAWLWRSGQWVSHSVIQ